VITVREFINVSVCCFSFQDRGKRLKLQQFVVKKAASLFDASLLEVDNESQDKPPGDEGEFIIIG